MTPKQLKFKLTTEEHERVFQKLNEEMLATSLPADNPRIVILGGQPGAGKSILAEIAKNQFFKGLSVAIINGDEYRDAHPHRNEILHLNDRRYTENTDPDVREWTRKVLDSAIRNRRNIIFEGTMRNQEPLMSTIVRLNEEGYRIDVFVMAVNASTSRLGAQERYEAQKELVGYGRWTSIKSHDEAAQNLANTVAAIEAISPIDSLSVFNRNKECLYTSDYAEVERSVRRTASLTVAREMRHLFSFEMKQSYQDIAERIQQKMQKRNDATN